MAVNLIQDYAHHKPVMTEEEFRKEFGRRVDYKTFERGLSFAAIAKKLYVTAETIRSYKRGDRVPDIYTCIKLAKILNCDLDYLIGFADDVKEDI